jgi:hypothetical protein
VLPDATLRAEITITFALLIDRAGAPRICTVSVSK